MIIRPITGTTAAEAQIATAIVNTKAFSQAVNMTAAASGSNGVTAIDNANLGMGTNNFTLHWEGNIPDWTPDTNIVLAQKTDGVNGWKLEIISAATQGMLQLTLNTTAYKSTIVTGLTDNTTAKIDVAVARESASTAGSVFFYVNGAKLGGTVTITAGVPTTVNNAVALYGMGTDTTRTAGVCQSFHIFNRCLDATDITSLHLNGIGFADKWGSQAELMPNQVDRDFSGASAWSNVDLTSYDETTDLTITATVANQYCTCPVASMPTTANKRYRLSFDVANIVSTWAIKSFDGTQTIGAVSANGTQVLEFIASTTGGLRIVANSTSSSGDFDNFSLNEIGAVLALESEGAQANRWEDSSTNNLDASYPSEGASLVRQPPFTTSAQFAAALSDETGTGFVVFSDSPTFTTQISTPKIVTASGDLVITPTSNANLILQNSGTGKVGIGTSGGAKFQIGTNIQDAGYTLPFSAWAENMDVTTKTIFQLGRPTISAVTYGGMFNINMHRWETSGTAARTQVDFWLNHGQTHVPEVIIMSLRSNGNIGIRVPSPTAAIHLPAGTATANTAPLQFTSGIVETTARSGLVEYDGTNFHFTASDTVRMPVNKQYVLASKLGANFNVTTDQSITIPAGRWVVRKIVVSNASISLTTAAGGIYTGASKTGTTIVGAAQVYSALTASGKYLDLTLDAAMATDILAATTIYFSLTTAQGAAATGDIFIIGDRLDY